MSGPPFITSESAADVLPAVARALAAMRDVSRSNIADAGNYTYSYASLDQVMGMARPILADQALAVTQSAAVHLAEHVVEVTTTIVHESGEWVAWPPLAVPIGAANAQSIGSALSYARRYGLLAVLGIATEDDDGATATNAARATPPAKKRAAKKAPPPDDRIPVAAAKGKLLELLGGDADLAREMWPSGWTGPVDRDALAELLDEARRRLTDEPAAVLEVRDLAERAGLDVDELLDVAETVTSSAVNDLGELDADELAALRDRLHATLADQLADEHGGDPT